MIAVRRQIAPTAGWAIPPERIEARRPAQTLKCVLALPVNRRA